MSCRADETCNSIIINFKEHAEDVLQLSVLANKFYTGWQNTSNCVVAELASFQPAVTLHACFASLLTTIILYIVWDCLFTSM